MKLAHKLLSILSLAGIILSPCTSMAKDTPATKTAPVEMAKDLNFETKVQTVFSKPNVEVKNILTVLISKNPEKALELISPAITGLTSKVKDAKEIENITKSFFDSYMEVIKQLRLSNLKLPTDAEINLEFEALATKSASASTENESNNNTITPLKNSTDITIVSPSS
jgi:hypothetical protein